MSKIAFDDEMDRRIEFNRIEGNSQMEESDFRHYLFTLGLLRYEFDILPQSTGKPYKAYYSIQGEKVVGRSGEVLA
jgi:hypothetical protein